MKAVNIIKQKGTIKKENPNAVKKSSSPLTSTSNIAKKLKKEEDDDNKGKR